MMNSPSGGGYQPPPWTGPAGVPPGKLRPGRIWYLVALAVFAGAAAWLVVGVFSFIGQVDAFQRVAMPQGGQVNLSHSGRYVIYYEGPGATSGRIPSFNVNVVPVSPGAAVSSLKPYTSSLTYTFGSHHGRAVLNLQVRHPGRFTVEGTGVPPAASGSDLAVGASITRGILGILVPSVPLMLLAGFGALVILIVRIARRSRLRAQPPAW